MHAVSIIVPTLNEASNVDILLKRIFSIEALQSYDFEIIFSDGCSTDNTCERIKNWFDTGQVRLVHTESGEGLAAAVVKAAVAASGEYLVVIDADLSHPPEVIPELLEPLVNEDYDMVIGSRYMRGGETPDWPFSRKLASILATIPARLLTDVKDPLAGFIALKRERLVSVKDKVYGFKIGLELLATGERELRVKEVPIVFRDRQYGTSKMETSIIVDYLHQLLILAGVHLFPGSITTVCKILLGVFFIDAMTMTYGVEHGFCIGVSQSAGWILGSSLAGGLVLLKIQTHDEGTENPLKIHHVLGWLWVTLLVLFLRSGLAAALGSGIHGLSTVAITLVCAAGLFFGYLGIIFYVCSIGRKRFCGQLVHRYYGIGVIAYLAILRLVYSAGLELLPEERYYWSISQTADTFFDILSLPAPAITGLLFHSLLGESVLGFRFGTWLIWFVSAVCIFNYARDLYNRSVAFRVLILYSVLPFFFGTGLYVSNDAVVTMFWCGAVYILYRVLVCAIPSTWIWAGLILGFGIQVSGVVALLIPGIVFFLIVDSDRKKIAFGNKPYVALACMTLTILPTLLAGSHKAVAIGKPLATWMDSIFCGSLPPPLSLTLFLLTPTGLLAGMYACLQWSRLDKGMTTVSHHLPAKNRLYLIGIFLIPWCASLIPGVILNGSLYAASLVWVALLPSIALNVAEEVAECDDGITRVLQKIWWPTIVLLVTLFGVMLHMQAL